MQIKLTSELSMSNGIKCLIYGASGVGKTTLASTIGGVLVISAEGGTLPLRGFNIPAIEIDNVEGLEKVYNFLAQAQDQWQYQTIIIDSLSELAEVCLIDAKKKTKDGRMTYNIMGEQLIRYLRLFRDLPGRNIVMLAKVGEGVDGMKDASLPGNKLSQKSTYFFDEVFYMGIATDEKVGKYRYLQTIGDERTVAKDRSNTLDTIEPPNLSYIFNKMLTGQQKPLQTSLPEFK